MSNQIKCEMARLRYCQKSSFGYCNANDTDVDKTESNWRDSKASSEE